MTTPATGFPVISSKITPHGLPNDVVRRPRLEALFESDRQVVVVTAPAGYGKSTLVANWVHHASAGRAAWVSLDPLDRSPLSFWTHVTGALAQVAPRVRESETILVERGEAGSEFLASLVHGLCEDGGPIVLVLDDLHHVDATTCREGLTTLVERCARSLRLVLTSRTDPPLPMRRWLAEGRAGELRLADLAFRVDEAVALMQRFSVASLADDQITRLNEHVEGWAVGLLLSGLTLEGRPDMAATLDDLLASDRHLTDYLIDEVLDRLPDELRTLALQLAAPTYFDAAIAVRITGRHDAGRLVEQLVRSNPFVVMTPSPPAYRFHRLIRSLLDTALHWQDPAAYEAAHRRAAEVMVERGHMSDAVSSLVAIGDIDAAFDLVTGRVLSVSDRGRVREMAPLLEMIGDARPSDAFRALDYAAALILAGRTATAIEWTTRAEGMRGADDPAFTTAHTITKATALAAAGFIDQAAACCTLLDPARGDVTGSVRLDGRMSGMVARIALTAGDPATADRWLPHVARHPEPPVSHVLHPALRAWSSIEQGQVVEALTWAQTACAVVERLALRPNLASFDALLSRAHAELLSLRLEEAAATLELLDEDGDAFPMPYVMLRWWPILVMHRALTDGWPSALELLGTLDVEGDGGRDNALGERYDELRALALLNCGMVDEAAPIVARLGTAPRVELLRARGDLRAGQHDRAEERLAERAGWRPPELLEALLLLAQVRSGAAALDTLRAALALAREGGTLAPFALEGRHLGQLLEALPLADLFPELAARLAPPTDISATRRSRRIVEPLTAKELAVLQRLPSHATYRAIGAELYVSVNTVKTYVSAVYRKLGVTTRAEAVEVARQCGLLQR